jgi:hypothetical protein
MKKLCLAGVAALFLATGAAHAADRNQFAPEVLGLWCAQEGHNIFAPRSTSYYREDCEDQGNKLILKPKETEEIDDICQIKKIKRATVPNVHGYDTEEDCGGEGESWKQKVRYVYFEGSSPTHSVLMIRVLWQSRSKPDK